MGFHYDLYDGVQHLFQEGLICISTSSQYDSTLDFTMWTFVHSGICDGANETYTQRDSDLIRRLITLSLSIHFHFVLPLSIV